MIGIMLGVVMLASSAGGSPAVETPRAAVAPASFNFNLPQQARTSLQLPQGTIGESPRPGWHYESVRHARLTTAQRSCKTGRIIGVIAGGIGGWFAGGAIGYAATAKQDHDVSGLRGVVMGAPLGAAVGAILGYQLAK